MIWSTHIHFTAGVSGVTHDGLLEAAAVNKSLSALADVLQVCFTPPRQFS